MINILNKVIKYLDKKIFAEDYSKYTRCVIDKINGPKPVGITSKQVVALIELLIQSECIDKNKLLNFLKNK